MPRIVPHDGTGRFDPTVTKIFDQLNTDIPIIPVTRWADYEFNDYLWELDKYILADYCEYDWDFDWDRGTHFFGWNTGKFKDKFPDGEWDKFDTFVKERPPALYLKREILKNSVGGNVAPVDYPSYVNPIPIQTEEEFNNRLISVCYYFGRSHEGRLRLHSDIWKGAMKYGYNVLDNIFYFNKFMEHEQGEKWVSLNVPHYSRHPINEILSINGISKIGIAPHGAGIKTFRNTEVSVNAIMLMWEDNLAWSYEWIDGLNCIKCKQGEEIETIRKALQNPNLYEIYKNGVETCNKYFLPTYTKNYLQPLIDRL